LNHLSGREVIGLYPLLPDNSSWFIAADFDESESGKINWQDEVKKFIDACEKYNLPVYLERSRSGRGGHVWMFFENSYPAFKSRKIMLHILESTGIISPFDKNSNYDRLFPNQDSHSGKGIPTEPISTRRVLQKKGPHCCRPSKDVESAGRLSNQLIKFHKCIYTVKQLIDKLKYRYNI
jgi:hypothetical protein